MLPSFGRQPFHRPGWVYEEKYDGWRMVAFKDGERVRLVSRQASMIPSDPATSRQRSPGSPLSA